MTAHEYAGMRWVTTKGPPPITRADLFAAVALHALLSDGYQPDVAAGMAAKAAEYLLADMDGH
jgi:hypothetical protein